MNDAASPDFRPPSIGSVKRRRIDLSRESMTKTTYFQTGQSLPLVVEPAVEGVDLIAWARNNAPLIQEHLHDEGGILFRNFGICSVDKFEQFVQATSDGEVLQYLYASTPRRKVTDKIYTSTEYPADQTIPLHNEMSYARRWPMKTWFFCLTPAVEGGETPLADSRRVFQQIRPQIRDKFIQKSVQYVRNYGGGLDLNWQDVFHASERTQVEAFCREMGIQFEWRQEDRLQTRQVCQAVGRHPRTGDDVWFNQAHLFHISSLQSQVRELLLAEFQEHELPRNAFYGDGSPIESEVLDEIRQIYQQEERIFTWREGDLLLLDNMLTAHGRRPFYGKRNVLVGMAEPFGSDQV